MAPHRTSTHLDRRLKKLLSLEEFARWWASTSSLFVHFWRVRHEIFRSLHEKSLRIENNYETVLFLALIAWNWKLSIFAIWMLLTIKDMQIFPFWQVIFYGDDLKRHSSQYRISAFSNSNKFPPTNFNSLLCYAFFKCSNFLITIFRNSRQFWHFDPDWKRVAQMCPKKKPVKNKLIPPVFQNIFMVQWLWIDLCAWTHNSKCSLQSMKVKDLLIESTTGEAA